MLLKLTSNCSQLLWLYKTSFIPFKDDEQLSFRCHEARVELVLSHLHGCRSSIDPALLRGPSDDFFASRRTKGFVLGGMGVCFLLLFLMAIVECIKKTKDQKSREQDFEMGRLNSNLIEESTFTSRNLNEEMVRLLYEQKQILNESNLISGQGFNKVAQKFDNFSQKFDDYEKKRTEKDQSHQIEINETFIDGFKYGLKEANKARSRKLKKSRR